MKPDIAIEVTTVKDITLAHIEESGRLLLQGETLCYDGGPNGAWRLPVTEIAVVGEYTNASGPWIEDYFLVFVRHDKSFVQSSFYATGSTDALAGLGVALGGDDLRPALCNSTEWKPEVLWPPQLPGFPLFVLQNEFPAGVWHRVLNAAGIVRQTALLSPAVEEFLSGVGRDMG